MILTRALGAVLTVAVLAPSASAATAQDSGDLLDVRELSTPVALSELAPGDSTEWAAEAINTGTSPHEFSVAFAVEGTDPLATDPDEGLQLAVDLCPSALSLSEQRTPDGRTFTRYLCPEKEIPLGVGPAKTVRQLAGVHTVDGGATLGVRVRALFPKSAGNTLENTAAVLRVIVTATEPGAAPVPEPGHDGLAATGRDLGAALLGGLLTLSLGAVFFAAGGRRRRREERS
ncbi:hypothetical protein [Rathayibacter toxicus]|uniref:hypothetical protein n=1 Tax=Rathayibacter toxicus TaxID=145458 RepID=UPI001C03C58F|nr:hypothetical protein [Rathayibacter toxicus]QWL31133.1 hypothetical protein E2R34_10530 [Rathayibacter toxicus]